MGWTALDCAAAAGALRCAELLLDWDSPVDPLDRKKTTPLHLSAIHGHAKLAELLMQHGADTTLEDVEGRNVLELAIIHSHRAVAEIIIDSSHWRSAMSTSHVVEEKGNFIPDTPMRMLIRVFPDLAQKVFDKCITRKPEGLELDYDFLDDSFSLRKEGKVFVKTDAPDVKAPYHPVGAVVKRNHCLMLMVKRRQKHLLKHPLCLGLLRHKWKTFGRYVFYSQFTLYCLFLASMTAYTLLQLDRAAWPGSDIRPLVPPGEAEVLLTCRGSTMDPLRLAATLTIDAGCWGEGVAEPGNGGGARGLVEVVDDNATAATILRFTVLVLIGINILFEFSQLLRVGFTSCLPYIESRPDSTISRFPTWWTGCSISSPSCS
jgi:hypothetical protein